MISHDMKPILLGANAPALSLQFEAIACSKALNKQHRPTQGVAELTEMDLFRLSMEEPEPRKSLPTRTTSNPQHTNHASFVAELNDSDLFRRSMGEAEPKKFLPTLSAPPTPFGFDSS